MNVRSCQILALLLCCGAAQAQLRLPSLGSTLPPLARSPLLQRVAPLVDSVLAPVDLATERLDEATRRQRAHPRELDRDPAGELIVRAEVLAQPSGAGARAALVAAGFQLLRDDPLAGVGDELLVLSAPAGVSLEEAIASARAIDPSGVYDFHHLYEGSGSVDGASAAPTSPGPAQRAPPAAGAPRVGLVDSGVDAAHPAFDGSTITRHGCGDGPHPAPHGTAVASLMVGQLGTFRSALPHATLVAADVYCDEATGGSVEAIARALSWIAQQRLAVVNVSLVGPPNKILGRVVSRLVEQGVLIVAAVGNDGPAAAPLYPAAWPGVVGVGAVDGRLRLLAEGARGPQVMFVAPGADMAAAANGERRFVPVRGTSFAAPLVAGLLAGLYQVPSPDGARAALAQLAALAHALPAPAPREGVGRGLVAESLRTPLDAVALVRNR